MDKFKQAARLFRQLADLFDSWEGVAAPAAQAVTDAPAPLKPSGTWVKYCLELQAPISKPRAERVMDRVAPTMQAKRQLAIKMGQGTGSNQAVVAFIVKVMDRGDDTAESAVNHLAEKMNARGSDKRARVKVRQVLAVA